MRNIVDGVLPDWYRTSIQTRERVGPTFSPYFAVHHIERGMDNWQDLAVGRL